MTRVIRPSRTHAVRPGGMCPPGPACVPCGRWHGQAPTVPRAACPPVREAPRSEHWRTSRQWPKRRLSSATRHRLVINVDQPMPESLVAASHAAQPHDTLITPISRKIWPRPPPPRRHLADIAPFPLPIPRLPAHHRADTTLHRGTHHGRAQPHHHPARRPGQPRRSSHPRVTHSPPHPLTPSPCPSSSLAPPPPLPHRRRLPPRHLRTRRMHARRPRPVGRVRLGPAPLRDHPQALHPPRRTHPRRRAPPGPPDPAPARHHPRPRRGGRQPRIPPQVRARHHPSQPRRSPHSVSPHFVSPDFVS